MSEHICVETAVKMTLISSLGFGFHFFHLCVGGGGGVYRVELNVHDDSQVTRNRCN